MEEKGELQQFYEVSAGIVAKEAESQIRSIVQKWSHVENESREFRI